MPRAPSPENAPRESDLTTATVLGRARRRGRPWRPSAAATGAPVTVQNDTIELEETPQAPLVPVSNRHFLTIDHRFGTPIHVFLELDPTGEPGFPGFRVRYVTLEFPDSQPGTSAPAGVAIGQDPHQLDRFRMFKTDRAVAGAGFILIEPRYIGPNWPAYILAFRPGGEKPGKRSGMDDHASKRR